MKKVFTVSEVKGSKRSSDRIYTHALVGFFNHDANIALASVVRDSDRKEWSYYQLCANGTVGVTVYSKHSGYTIDQQQKDRGLEIVAKYGNKENYAVQLAAKRKADAEARKANGTELQVLRWSMSEKNAGKGLSEFSSYMGLRVVPVTQIK